MEQDNRKYIAIITNIRKFIIVLYTKIVNNKNIKKNIDLHTIFIW